jgi:hypothetical protein
VDRAHGPMDHWPDFGSQSTVDHGHEQWPKLAGARLAGVPVRGTSPRRQWKQEEGMGISTPVGTRRQRGSDGRVMVDRGGSQSSSMRGRSRCAIKAPVTRKGDDRAVTIHGEIEEESVARRFSSIQVQKGVHRWWAERLGLRSEEEDDPGGLELGRVQWAQWPMGPVSVRARKKWRRAARGNGPKLKNKKMGCLNGFKFI